jgi:NitT/TauT family transport system permease protein
MSAPDDARRARHRRRKSEMGVKLRDRFALLLPPVIVGIVILATWEILCRVFEVPPYLFPAPSIVAKSLQTDAASLAYALWMTVRVTLTALALSIVLGSLIAFVFVQSPIIERSLFPYAIIMQVTPIVAVAPLIIILVKNTQVALVICATVIAIFPIISNTTIGLRSIDRGHQNLFAINQASRLQNLLYLRIPSALPFFFAGLKIASGLALIGAVVAEFVAGTGGRSAGLAFEILQSGYQLEIPRMFAALFLITLTGIVLFLAVSGLTNWVLGAWHDSAARQEA